MVESAGAKSKPSSWKGIQNEEGSPSFATIDFFRHPVFYRRFVSSGAVARCAENRTAKLVGRKFAEPFTFANQRAKSARSPGRADRWRTSGGWCSEIKRQRQLHVCRRGHRAGCSTGRTNAQNLNYEREHGGAV